MIKTFHIRPIKYLKPIFVFGFLIFSFSAGMLSAHGTESFDISVSSSGDGVDDLLRVIYTVDPCTSFTRTEGDVIHPLCFGGNDGHASVVVTGGTSPYSYSWEDEPMNTDSVRTGLTAGTYKVYIEDAVGCLDSLTFNLNQPDEIVISLEQLIDETCPDAEDGSIEVSATGGTGTLSFSWSSGGNTAVITNLGAGTYTVTVTDVNECTEEDTFDVVLDDTVCVSNGVALLYNTDGTKIPYPNFEDGLVALGASDGMNPGSGGLLKFTIDNTGEVWFFRKDENNNLFRLILLEGSDGMSGQSGLWEEVPYE